MLVSDVIVAQVLNNHNSFFLSIFFLVERQPGVRDLTPASLCQFHLLKCHAHVPVGLHAQVNMRSLTRVMYPLFILLTWWFALTTAEMSRRRI
jgi:hypothetical protein